MVVVVPERCQLIVVGTDAPCDGAPTATKLRGGDSSQGLILQVLCVPGEVQAPGETSRRKSKKGIKLALDHGLL
jgi:hypothetical protein